MEASNGEMSIRQALASRQQRDSDRGTGTIDDQSTITSPSVPLASAGFPKSSDLTKIQDRGITLPAQYATRVKHRGTTSTALCAAEVLRRLQKDLPTCGQPIIWLRDQGVQECSPAHRCSWDVDR